MTNNEINNSEKEVSLLDIVKVVKEYWGELWRYWYLVPLFCLPTVAFYMYKHFTHEVKYTAQIKYMVEGGSSSPAMLNGILGQFGIGGTERGFGPRKISEVIKSKFNIANIVLDTTDQMPILGNEIIDVYRLDEDWSEDKPKWSNFRFKNTQLEKLDSMEVKALVSIYKLIVGNKNTKHPLLKYTFDEDTEIMKISVSTIDPNLSIRMVNTIFDRTKEFFEIRIFEDQIKSIQLLAEKKDSLENYIESREFDIARFQSSNRGLIDEVSLVPLNRMRREISLASVALGEVMRSYEASDYSLKSMKPYFLALDKPLGPPSAEFSSIIIRFIIGVILGGMFYVTFIVGRKLFRDSLRESKADL